ncbi:MAG TPA: hypothetical protein VM012_00620 [Flavitalea sp.]|nr:hypothetical protein [Flavitalea sp.]
MSTSTTQPRNKNIVHYCLEAAEFDWEITLAINHGVLFSQSVIAVMRENYLMIDEV